MTFYGYIAPMSRHAGIDPSWITTVLTILGVGLVIGNNLGGRMS